MAAGLESLRDYNLGAGSDGIRSLIGRADLAQHENSGGAQSLHQMGPQVPEQGYSRDLRCDSGFQFGLQQIGRRCGGNEIDAERPAGGGAHPRYFDANEIGRFTHHTEEAKAAGFADGGDQLRTRYTAHAGENNRVIAAEKAANGSLQLRDHSSKLRLARLMSRT